ncbi:MAG: flagellin, partial [Lachnospiraceae bacterium]|nr:flagellin [Lachnospiraceae bacterium]
MVVQHNLTAMNTNRQLGITTGQQAKATEKLSSGYKVNRAADDAAGLTISEKMRSQIRGLGKAS